MFVSNHLQLFLRLALCLVLAVWLPAMPVMSDWMELEESRDTNEPVDSDDKENSEESKSSTTSASHRLDRQSRHPISTVNGRLVVCSPRPLWSQQASSSPAGPRSFWGRLRPLHC